MSRPARVAVRHGRSGLELRVDGTLASLQRPGAGVTGPVWWALAAPLVLLPPGRRRVLVLGLAAGSVARALRALDPSATIVGVERDEGVLQAARRHFGLGRLGLEIVADDALAYLRRERRSFDMVVEDIFVGTARRVRKPDWLLEEGYPLVLARLRPRGLLVSNTIEELPGVVRALRPCPGRRISLDVRDYWNRVLVCGRDVPPAAAARRTLAAHPLLAPLLRQLSLRAR